MDFGTSNGVLTFFCFDFMTALITILFPLKMQFNSCRSLRLRSWPRIRFHSIVFPTTSFFKIFVSLLNMLKPLKQKLSWRVVKWPKPQIWSKFHAKKDAFTDSEGVISDSSDSIVIKNFMNSQYYSVFVKILLSDICHATQHIHDWMVHTFVILSPYLLFFL